MTNGLCHCGCGKPTRLSTTTSLKRGVRVGEPTRFLPGHGSHNWHPTPMQRVCSRIVLPRDPAGCWLWSGYKNVQGYGLYKSRYKSNQAHRIIWSLFNGDIPTGLELDHLCRNRGCVNPDHMEPVTHRENVMRGVSPTAILARKTHCKHGHPLTGDNLYPANRKHPRVCRLCAIAASKRYIARKRAAA